MIIRPKHLRLLKFCAAGTQRWFAVQGLDWRDFLRNGIDEEKLLATGDPRVAAIIAAAHREENAGSPAQGK